MQHRNIEDVSASIAFDSLPSAQQEVLVGREPCWAGGVPCFLKCTGSLSSPKSRRGCRQRAGQMWCDLGRFPDAKRSWGCIGAGAARRSGTRPVQTHPLMLLQLFLCSWHCCQSVFVHRCCLRIANLAPTCSAQATHMPGGCTLLVREGQRCVNAHPLQLHVQMPCRLPIPPQHMNLGKCLTQPSTHHHHPCAACRAARERQHAGPTK